MSPENRRALAPLLVFVLAVAVRLAFIAAVPGWNLDAHDLVGDPNDYHQIASSLAHGHGYAMPWFGPGAGHGELRPTAYRPPGLPVTLAALYKVTKPSPFAARLLLVGVDALTCALVVLLGRMLAGPRTGLVAGLLAALYPPLWVNVGTVMSEPLFTLAIVAALIAAERFRRRPGLGAAALVGAALGVATLTRTNGVFLVVGVATWAAWRAGMWRAAAAVAGSALLVVLPWEVRTVRGLHAPVFLTTQGGSALAGSYSSAMLDRRSPAWGGWDVTVLTREVRYSKDEVTFDRRLRRTGVEWVKAHPGGTATLLGLHVVRYFDLYWDLGGRRELLVPTASRAVNVAAVLSWWVVGALAVAGAAREWRRGNLGPFAAPIVAFAAVALNGVLLAAGPRYRAPAEPIVVLLAATFLVGRREVASAS